MDIFCIIYLLSKALHNECFSFPHSHTHSHTNGVQGTNQLVGSNWGLGVLLRDTSNCQMTALTSYLKKIYIEPRSPSGLRRWFANATHQGMGSWILPLPRAELGRLTLEWHNWPVTPREGGRTQQLRCASYEPRVYSYTDGRMRLGEGISLSGSLDPNWGCQGRGVCSGSK